MLIWRRKFRCTAGLSSSLQLAKTNENGGGGVWISEGAKCAHFKENRHHEKDRNRLCCACRNFCELRRSAGAKARAQIHTGDDRAGPDETQHRKDIATGTDDKSSAERPGNIAFAGGG